MTGGHNGESCAEAIRASVHPGERVSFGELFKRTKKRGTWTDRTVRLHLMQVVVNLPPARFEWPTAYPFLLLNLDGTYELYDPKRHPKTIES